MASSIRGNSIGESFMTGGRWHLAQGKLMASYTSRGKCNLVWGNGPIMASLLMTMGDFSKGETKLFS